MTAEKRSVGHIYGVEGGSSRLPTGNGRGPPPFAFNEVRCAVRTHFRGREYSFVSMAVRLLEKCRQNGNGFGKMDTDGTISEHRL
jgi:hypothetical protein